MKSPKILLCLLLTGPLAHGAAGMFDQFVFTTTNNGPLTFYDIGTATDSADFAGADLGSFNPNTQIFEIGGQQKTFKNNGTDVTASALQYRVWLTSGGATGSFITVNMPFQANLGGDDQRWGGDVSDTTSTDILSGLSNGAYTLEVFSQVTTNGNNEATTVFNNVGGSNYQASFQVVPEPSAALLGAIGTIFLLRRRK